jgi:hypothetical protein
MTSEFSPSPHIPVVPNPVAANPAEAVYRAYAALAGVSPFDVEAGLGGKLLFAGEITERSRELLFAANIAGAASLAASADTGALRLAIRDGVIDFSVTSLEEALRILKNEIRKRQPVSVGVAVDSRVLVEQMVDRGVLPDLLPPLDPELAGMFLKQGARQVVDPVNQLGEFVTWSVDREFNRWLTKLDACVKDVIPADDRVRLRWLRLAPRYLGRIAQRQRGVMLGAEELERFRDKARDLFQEHPEASVRVEINGQLLG